MEKADKVLHGICRDEPLNWVLHQESSRIEANLDRAWGTERQISFLSSDGWTGR